MFKGITLIEIYHLTGCLVYSKKGRSKGNFSIIPDVFPQGMHLLKITSSDQQIFKIIRK